MTTNSALSEPVGDDELEVNMEALEGLWYSEGDIEESDGTETGLIGADGVVCPNPKRWVLARQSPVDARLQRVSPVIAATSAPIDYTFTVSRSLTFTWGVTAGVKAGIGLIEAQTGISLQTSVQISTQQQVRFHVPKGARMALFGGATYMNRTFTRTVYSSAGPCYPVTQTTVVSSPKSPVLVVRNV
jgi:hypothetical protein